MVLPAPCANNPNASSILSLVDAQDSVAALQFVTHAKQGQWRRVRKRTLVKQYGISEASARRIEAALRLACELAAPAEPALLHSAGDVAELIYPLLTTASGHAMWVVGVDPAGRALEPTCVALGRVGVETFLPKDVFAHLLRCGASSGFIVHTLPEGAAEASHADLLTLRQLVAAGDLIGMPIADMVIVAPDSYCSALEQWMQDAGFDEVPAELG